MALGKSLQSTKALTDGALRDLFREKYNKALTIDPYLAELIKQIQDFTLRSGKRIRPFLCLLGYESVISDKRQVISKKKIPQELLYAMMGIELFQTFALIHDDIIDEDKKRRGGPTVHEYYHHTHNAQRIIHNAHFGTSMAILAGDLALSWADELIVETQHKRAIEHYQTMKEETIYGQALDVLREQGRSPIKKEYIDTLKTAYYSIIRPLQIGAVLGGGTEKQLDTFERYGLLVGRAFQGKDDVMDKAITEGEFSLSVKPLIAKAKTIIFSTHLCQEEKQLLVEFADFVITRKA